MGVVLAAGRSERLKAVAGKLKYGDTKEDVGKTLQQLEKPGAEPE